MAIDVFKDALSRFPEDNNHLIKMLSAMLLSTYAAAIVSANILHDLLTAAPGMASTAKFVSNKENISI